MKYRQFGKLDWKVSVLGFGAMRLPLIGGDRGNIDEEEALKMVRYSFDHGVNYIDTAYPYHSGNSESFVGKALKDGYREKVKLATKMPIQQVNSRKDLDRIFNEQLNKLQTEYVDFYLFHGVNKDRWLKIMEINALDWAEKEIASGRIGHLGFSFHDTYEVFKEVLDGYNRWTFCQMQYNYVDAESRTRSPGTRGLKYAASKGLAVVVMEGIQGGNLAVKPPEEIQAIWDEAETRRTPAEWALQWLWNQPEISVVLSGMSTMNQVVENLESTNRSGPGTLPAEELSLISRVRSKIFEHGFIGCTSCQYCQPCPQNVAIPDILALYNEYYTKREDSSTQQEIIDKYGTSITPERRAGLCIKCGECEDKCPQQLPIRNLLARATRSFE
ncbi:MAG: aldo/keto reductase [Candidatus Bathyarchaeia archaeon]